MDPGHFKARHEGAFGPATAAPEKPILFSAPMVRAILAGRKTQTRRLVRSGRPCRFAPGDRLWVRETWRETPAGFEYRADREDATKADGQPWRPSIFMPRRAARVFLRVEAVRQEPLAEMSLSDLRCEGFYSLADFQSLWNVLNQKHPWWSNALVWVIRFKTEYQVGTH